jgi:hypothetical protein
LNLSAAGVGTSQSFTQGVSFAATAVQTSFPTGADLVRFNRLLIEDAYGSALINPSGDQLGLTFAGFWNTLGNVAKQACGSGVSGQQLDLLNEYLSRAGLATGVVGDPTIYLSAELGAPEAITTTYVGAASQAGTKDPKAKQQNPGKAAISGTVDWLTIDNAGKAWIGPGAKINQNPSDAPPTDVMSSLNLLDGGTLIQTLAAQAGKTSSTGDPVSYYLWNSMTAAQQATLTSANSTTAQMHAALIAVLNAAITGGTALNKLTDFSHITLSAATQKLLAVTSPTAQQLQTLNHLLLIDAYPTLLTDPSVSIQGEATIYAINAGGITALPFGILGAASSLFGGTFGANQHSNGGAVGATVVLLQLTNSADAYIGDGALVNSATDIGIDSRAARRTTGDSPGERPPPS